MEQVGTVIFGKCIIVYRAGHLYQRLHVVCVVTPVKQLLMMEVRMSLSKLKRAWKQNWERVQRQQAIQELKLLIHSYYNTRLQHL